MGECEELLRMWFNEVGTNQTNEVGTNQTNEVGTNQTNEVGTNQTNKVGTNQTNEVGTNQTNEVGTNQTNEVVKGQINKVYEISKDYAKIKKDEEDFDLSLSRAVKKETENKMKLYSTINEYDKKLQNRLGLTYIRDFYLFVITLDCLIADYFVYKTRIEEEHLRKSSKKSIFSFYLSPILEHQFNKKKWDMLYIYFRGSAFTKNDNSYRKLHSLFSTIKNKNILYYRYFKEQNKDLDKINIRFGFFDKKGKYINDIVASVDMFKQFNELIKIYPSMKIPKTEKRLSIITKKIKSDKLMNTYSNQSEMHYNLTEYNTYQSQITKDILNASYFIYGHKNIFMFVMSSDSNFEFFVINHKTSLCIDYIKIQLKVINFDNICKWIQNRLFEKLKYTMSIINQMSDF